MQTRESHRKCHRNVTIHIPSTFFGFVACTRYSSRGLGGVCMCVCVCVCVFFPFILLTKTAVSEAISGSRAVHTCCCSYCCMAGDLARANQAQLPKIYCDKRDINLSRRKVCSVYHVLRKCTRGDSAVYLHRAGPGVMGHRRCLKGYDRASK